MHFLQTGSSRSVKGGLKTPVQALDNELLVDGELIGLKYLPALAE